MVLMAGARDLHGPSLVYVGAAAAGWPSSGSSASASALSSSPGGSSTSGLLTDPEHWTHLLFSLVGLYFLGAPPRAPLGELALLARFIAIGILLGEPDGSRGRRARPARRAGEVSPGHHVRSDGWPSRRSRSPGRATLQTPPSISFWSCRSAAGRSSGSRWASDGARSHLSVGDSRWGSSLRSGGSSRGCSSSAARHRLARERAGCGFASPFSGEAPKSSLRAQSDVLAKGSRPERRQRSSGPPLAGRAGGLDKVLKKCLPPKDKRHLNHLDRARPLPPNPPAENRQRGCSPQPQPKTV